MTLDGSILINDDVWNFLKWNIFEMIEKSVPTDLGLWKKKIWWNRDIADIIYLDFKKHISF